MARYSKLEPYVSEIVAMRLQEPPMPYVQIAIVLQEKYQISIQRAAIQKFLKTRARGYKPCRYAGKIAKNNRLTIEVKAGKKPQVMQASKPEISMIEGDPKSKKLSLSEHDDMPSSETYSLHRLSEDEAAALLKEIEEEERNQR